ncbi:uncharacterized protein LOC144443321 [Glandiceps talaboti]
MQNFIFAVVILALCAFQLFEPGVNSAPAENAAADNSTVFKCFQCSADFTSDSQCKNLKNIDANATDSDIKSVECTGMCYEEVDTAATQIAKVRRGCKEECEESKGCKNAVGTGTCRKCCTGEYCNADLNAGGTAIITASIFVILLALLVALLG